MKLDESALTAYLVKNIRPITSADPAILAKYIIVLLRKDRPVEELEVLCNESLTDFLGNSTKSFVTNLFQVIENGAIVRPQVDFDETMTFEPPLVLDQKELQVLPSKSEEHFKSRKEQLGQASSSGTASDSEEQEISDDDDDRNHKHRKRDSRLGSFDDDGQMELLRRPFKKPSRGGVNGVIFDTNQLPNTKNVANEPFDRDPLMKFEKHSSSTTSLPRFSVDFGQRGRISNSRSSSSSQADFSSSFTRASSGRGRGRGAGNWSQQDSRFLPLGTLDFPSRIAPRGPPLPGMFLGTNLPSATGTPNVSWSSFGFIPGMSNGCMDPLHPLSMPSALHTSIGSQMNLAMPRQRCRDFEEQGFCLRGDMCPMEHGVNRIVVEDVQSLSQFNLPVSLPTSHIGGIQATPSMGAFSSLPRSKVTPSKVSKSSLTDGVLGVSNVLPSAAAGDNDVYDPDKPLWTNDSLNVARDPLRALDSDDPGSFHDGDPSLHEFKLPHKGENRLPSGISSDDGGPHTQEAFGPGIKPKMTRKTDTALVGTRCNENDTAAAEEVTVDIVSSSTRGAFAATTEINQKISMSMQGPRSHKGTRKFVARTSQKASRTLFVSHIPVKTNSKNALLSHFQKFGTVIDIYIPSNGEKAFVQFSKREEAEAALESPDAVMGNRFIKLFWAKWDNISDDNFGMEDANPPALLERAATTTLLNSSMSRTSQSPSTASKVCTGTGMEPMSSVPKSINVSVCDTAPALIIHSKSQMTSAPKVLPPMQKKLESLEMLEEIRKKHESLEKKRIEFRNRLDKLEKQSVVAKKVGGASVKFFKKQKVEKDSEDVKSAVSTQPDCVISGKLPDSFANEHSQNDTPLISQFTERSIKHEKLASASPHTFEICNKPSWFRILPPLPVDFTTLAVIEGHFSKFQDFVRVDLEDSESVCADESSNSFSNISARVIFTTPHSAERAFSDGSCWKGKILKFAWLNSGCPRTDPYNEHTPLSANKKEIVDSNIHSKLVATGSSLPSLVVDASDNCKHMDMNFGNLSDQTIEQPFSSTKLSMPCHSATADKDNIDADFLH